MDVIYIAVSSDGVLIRQQTTDRGQRTEDVRRQTVANGNAGKWNCLSGTKMH